VSAAASLSVREYLRGRQQQVDARLEQLLPPPGQRPESIHRAMRHSVFAGGKRIRPALCLEAAAVVDRAAESGALDVACALEMIHTYSLIHDDLPALDNDDFRRGVPTCHKVFGDAVAILAGDALLTLAFEVLASGGPAENERRAAILAEVARAAGTVDGMIGGQVVDLESEGRAVDGATVEYIHRAKTAAMLRAAVRCGALAAGAPSPEYKALSEYGGCAGLAFQIVDDILDVQGSTEELGKTAGKDAAQRKATYPSVFGLDRSRQMAGDLIAQAVSALAPFGERARWLREIAFFLGERKS